MPNLTRREVLTGAIGLILAKSLPQDRVSAQEIETPSTGLILIDGLLSKHNNDINPKGSTFRHFAKDLFPNYALVAPFSYKGGEALLRPNRLPYWISNQYESSDTLQSISKSAEVLKDMIDALKPYHPLDVLAYSLGGVVFNSYAARCILPENGTHKDGVIRRAVTMHSPLNGIAHPLPPDAGGEAVRELFALARNPEITVPVNIAVARFLKNRRSIDILTLGNNNDRLVPPPFSTIQGFGNSRALGQDCGSTIDCDNDVRALFSLEGLGAGIGHTQLLTDPIALKEIIEFLTSAPADVGANKEWLNDKNTISPLQKSIIGKTTTQDIEKTNPTMGKQILPSGEIKYEIESTLIGRPNEMIFENNTAKFERIITIKGATESGKLKISSQILKFGPAEKIIEGSEFYGARIKTYIYPSKGFAFIANPNADEIYELQTFIPTTIDDYLSKYGEDIKEYGEIRE